MPASSITTPSLSPKTTGLIIIAVILLLCPVGWFFLMHATGPTDKAPANGAVTSGYAPPGVPAGAKRPQSQPPGN